MLPGAVFSKESKGGGAHAVYIGALIDVLAGEKFLRGHETGGAGHPAHGITVGFLLVFINVADQGFALFLIV